MFTGGEMLFQAVAPSGSSRTYQTNERLLLGILGSDVIHDFIAAARRVQAKAAEIPR